MSQWIAGITRGHNAGVCLLKDGEIVFAVEEERLSREKYDGAPLLSLMKVKEYTDTLDYLAVAHVEPMEGSTGELEFTQEDTWTGLARKLGLITRPEVSTDNIERDPDSFGSHPKVIDYGRAHHKMHAAAAFYRSGFDEAVAVIVDGSGSCFNIGKKFFYETESIFLCNYPAQFSKVYQHLGGSDSHVREILPEFKNNYLDSEDTGQSFTIIDDCTGIAGAFLGATIHCVFGSLEAGKTMGLAPYGKPNPDIPSVFVDQVVGNYYPVNKNMFVPVFPPGCVAQSGKWDKEDLAYAVQRDTQEKMVQLIRDSVVSTGRKNVVLSGGYGLNCVANYEYLRQLKDEGINLYVEPVSHDGGTAIGAALYQHYKTTGDTTIRDYSSAYLGPEYDYSDILS